MKTIVYVGASLDGFLARSNGDLGWLADFGDAEVGTSYREFMEKVDAVVIGRGTFEKVLSFDSWPYDNKVYVLSSTLGRVPERLRHKAGVTSMAPQALLRRLAGEGFQTIYVDGGKVIQSFLREDSIDEMIITRVPVLIGKGIPLFGDLKMDLRFQHLETHVFSNGLVRSRYARTREIPVHV